MVCVGDGGGQNERWRRGVKDGHDVEGWRVGAQYGWQDDLVLFSRQKMTIFR